MPLQLLGEFEPYLQSWEIDRVGVHRIVMALEYNASPPIDEVPPPPRDVLHVRTVVTPTDADSHGIVQFFFEGATLEDIGRAVPQYDINGSYNQEPIISHPKIVELLKKYRGRYKDGRVEWPPKLAGSSLAGLARRATDGGVNPLYGVDNYLDCGAVWSETRIYRKLPDTLWSGICEIYENPPGNPPDPGRRNWLKLPPSGRQRGNVTEVTVPFLLSGRNGWVRAIYDGSIA